MTGTRWPRSPRPRRRSPRRRCELIEVEYHVLPHVIDVEEAMKPDAPLLHDDLFTQGVEPKPTRPSNIAKRVAFAKGDIEAGFRDGRCHRSSGAIRPSRCIRPISSRMPASSPMPATASARSGARARASSWSAPIAPSCSGIDISDIRAIPAEIGGGFGGKTLVYLEPVALALAKKSGRPVKMVMSREEVFRGTGPTSGGVIEVKIGAKKDGRIVAADLALKYQAGAFPGSPVGPGCMCGFAMYDIPQRQHRRLRRRLEPAEGRGLSRAGRADLVVRRRKLHGRTGRPARHRPAGAAREERGQGRHQGGARADLRQYRLCRDRRRGQEPPASAAQARPQPGPRRRLRASGSTSAASRVRRCTSTRTAPRSSSRATPTSAARAPRSR